MLSVSLRVQRSERSEREAPETCDRPTDTHGYGNVASAEVALFLQSPVPALRFFTNQVQAERTAPSPNQMPTRRHTQTVQIPRPVPVRVLVEGELGEAGPFDLDTAERATDSSGDHRIPGSGSELDVLVRQTKAAKRKRIGFGAPKRDRYARACAVTPRPGDPTVMGEDARVAQAGQGFIAMVGIGNGGRVRLPVEILITNSASHGSHRERELDTEILAKPPRSRNGRFTDENPLDMPV